MTVPPGAWLGGFVIRILVALILTALLTAPAVALPLPTPPSLPTLTENESQRSVLRPGAFDETKPLREAFQLPVIETLPLLASSASAASQGPSCEPTSDAGEDTGTATPLAWPTTCEGKLEGATNQKPEFDLFALTITSPTYLVITLEVPDGYDHELCLLSQWESACSRFRGSWDEQVQYAVTNGTWWIDIWTYGANASYVLDVAAGTPPPAQNDCGSGSDASDSGGSPTPIAYPASCAGRIEQYDTDVYSIELAAGEALDALMVPAAFGDFDMCVFGPTGEVYDCSFADGPGLPDRVLVYADLAGTWTLMVDWWAGRGDYTLDVAPTSPPPSQNDCGTGVDASWRRSAPTPVQVPLQCDATLGEFDALDWFSLDLDEEDHFELRFRPAIGTELDVCIFTPRGGYFACGNAFDDSARNLLGGGSAGKWTLVIYSAGERGPYTLSLVDIERPLQDDCLTGADAADYRNVSTRVNLPTTCTGLVHDLDTRDFYAAAVPADSWISATITFDDSSEGWVCAYAELSRCQTDGRAVGYTAAAGDVVFMVYHTGNATTYTVTFEIAPPPPVQSDCGTGRDLEYGSGYNLAIGETCAGVLAQDYGDQYDDYEHWDETADGLRVRVTSESPFTVCAYGWEGSDCQSTTDGQLELEAPPQAGLLRVTGDGEYTIELLGVWQIQEEQDSILIGHSVTEEPIVADPNGTMLDAKWVELDQPAVGGETLQAAARTRGVLLDLGRIEGSTVELRFYDGGLIPLGDTCAIADAPAACPVPLGATWVRVTANDGAQWEVDIQYRYLDIA